MTDSSVSADAEALFRKMKKRGPQYDNRALIYTYDTVPEYIVKNCESPIEQMLYIALEFFRPDFMVVSPQTEVIWYKAFPDQKEYVFRPDFMIGFDWFRLTPDWEYAARGDWWDTGEAYAWLPFFAVECDGRDYHNHHEAIERDKRRDRVFAARGMQVMRFTGSEIYRDAESCATQIVQLFNWTLRERLRPGVWPQELIPHGTKIVLGRRWSSA